MTGLFLVGITELLSILGHSQWLNNREGRQAGIFLIRPSCPWSIISTILPLPLPCSGLLGKNCKVAKMLFQTQSFTMSYCQKGWRYTYFVCPSLVPSFCLCTRSSYSYHCQDMTMSWVSAGIMPGKWRRHERCILKVMMALWTQHQEARILFHVRAKLFKQVWVRKIVFTE